MSASPVEPPPTRWRLPTRAELAALPEPAADIGDQGPDDLVAHGADLEPGTLLAAYRAGMFPMPVGRRGGPAWWCPVRRGVLDPARFHTSRSLVRSTAHLSVTVDTDFAGVLAGCARTDRPGGWIDARVAAAYTRLHQLGWAHSVEARDADGRLVGGVYGVALGGLFAGESMFHEDSPAGRDASKVALRHLCAVLTGHAGVPGGSGDTGDTGAGGDGRLLDVQWVTPHLASLGVTTMGRRSYLARLPELLATPQPAAFTSAQHPSDGSPKR